MDITGIQLRPFSCYFNVVFNGFRFAREVDAAPRVLALEPPEAADTEAPEAPEAPAEPAEAAKRRPERRPRRSKRRLRRLSERVGGGWLMQRRGVACAGFGVAIQWRFRLTRGRKGGGKLKDGRKTSREVE